MDVDENVDGPIHQRGAPVMDEADELFRLVMDGAAIGMCLVAPDGDFLRVNRAICSMLGRTEADLIRCTWQQLTHPDDLSVDLALVDDVKAGRIDSYRLAKRYLRADGSTLWGDLSVSALRNGDQTVRLFVAQILDVTEMIAVQSELERSEANYRLLVENATDVAFRGSNDGVVEWISSSVTRLLGWSPGQIVGRPFLDLVHPHDLPAVVAAQASVNEARSARFETRLRDSRGGYRWILVNVGPDVNSTGDVVGRVGGWRDIQSARDFVAALADREQRLRQLLQNSTDVVFDIAADGSYRWVSPAVQEVLGWSPEELVGLTPADLVHPDDLTDVSAALSRAVDGQSAVAEFRIRCVDGGYRWVSATSRQVHDEGGNVTGRVVGMRDVHEQVLAQRALAQSEARYRLLAENSSDVVIQVRGDGLLDWVSPSTTVALGWSAEALVGTAPWELIHPDDHERAITALVAASQKAMVDPIEVRVKHLDGTFRWMSSAGRGVGEDRVVVGLRDIGESVRARERALADRERLQATLESLIDPHVLLGTVRDDEARIIDFVVGEANEAARTYLGMDSAALIGTRLLELVPGEFAQELVGLCSQAMESGEPVVLDDVAYATEDSEDARRFDIRVIRVGTVLSCTWRDVTERHRATVMLAASEEQYRLLANNSTDVVVHTRNQAAVWVSPSLTDMLGWHRSEWIGEDLNQFIHPEDMPTLIESRQVVAGGERDIVRIRGLAKDGQYHWVELHVRPFIDNEGERDGAVVTLRVIDQVVAAERALRNQARTDELTGLLNRRETFALLERILANPPRSGNAVAVAFADLDNFKDVNDMHGHAAGDFVLLEIARRLKDTVRAGDLVARFGGDELVVVFDGVHNLTDAVAIAGQIREAIARPMVLADATIAVTASIGVTLAGRDESVDTVLARVDRAMYDSKRAGGNSVVAIG